MELRFGFCVLNSVMLASPNLLVFTVMHVCGNPSLASFHITFQVITHTPYGCDTVMPCTFLLDADTVGQSQISCCYKAVVARCLICLYAKGIGS